DTELALELLESYVRLRVAERARARIFIHAGVVGWQGGAILLPGQSSAGKTTLVAELVRAGTLYYSDEYAVVDSKGRVHPFAQPLAMRGPEGGPQIKCPVEQLGGQEGQAPLSVRLVAITRYEAGAVWRPHQLTRGEGILALLEHTVAARRKPATVLQ